MNVASSRQPDVSLLRLAAQLSADRERRAGNFPRSIFGEPAWDMLLKLYTADDSDGETVERLANAAGVQPTTASRWLCHLESVDLVRRIGGRPDVRPITVRLTGKAFKEMTAYLASLAPYGRDRSGP